MFQSGEYLIEYFKWNYAAKVIKYKFENDELIIVDQWYSNDLVDITSNNHNAHSFFLNSDISHLVYTHDELQVIYELTDNGEITRRYRGSEPLRLRASSLRPDMIFGSVNQATWSGTWGYIIDYENYSIEQHSLINEVVTYWNFFGSKYVIKNNSEAIVFDSNFQVSDTKSFGVANNGLAQVPSFNDSDPMVYDESSQKFFVLGYDSGWKLYYWQHEPELNTATFKWAYSFNFPLSGDTSPEEMQLLGIENNKIYIRYNPEGESLSDVIYTIAYNTDELELLLEHQVGNSVDYSINYLHVKNHGIVLLYENDPEHFYLWCPIQVNGLISSCKEKQFSFSESLIRQSGTYKIVKLAQAKRYLMYGAEYGRDRKNTAPRYSDAHILQFDDNEQTFTLLSSLQGIDDFIENVYVSGEWSTIFLKRQSSFKGYSQENEEGAWIEFSPDDYYNAAADKVNQDSIYVTNECETFVYSEAYKWLYFLSDDEDDFWSTDCLPIDNSVGINLGRVREPVSPDHIATYKVVEQYPTKQIRSFPFRSNYQQDELINFDLAKYFVNPGNLLLQQGRDNFNFDGQFLTGSFDKYDVSGDVGDVTVLVLTFSTDDESGREYNIRFDIENINDAPILTTPFENDVLDVGDYYGGDFNDVFVDLEGDRIIYTFENLPSEFQIVGNGKIEGVFNQSGEYSFIVIATDSNGAATRQIVEFTVGLQNSSAGSLGYLFILLVGFFVKIRKLCGKATYKSLLAN